MEPAPLRPAADARVGERGVAELGHAGYPAPCRLGQAAAGPRSAARRGPPAPAEGRGGHHADHDLRAVHQPDERRPHRYAADVVLGAVDRVDDPAPWPAAPPARLLAEHRVPGPRPAQHVAQRLFGGPVGVGYRRQVGLGLDPQVKRTETARRDVIGGVSEDVREAQVVVVASHPRNGTVCHIPLTSAPPPRWASQRRRRGCAAGGGGNPGVPARGGRLPIRRVRSPRRGGRSPAGSRRFPPRGRRMPPRPAAA